MDVYFRIHYHYDDFIIFFKLKILYKNGNNYCCRRK